MVQHGHGVHKLKGMHFGGRGGWESGALLCNMKHDICCKDEHGAVKRTCTKAGKTFLNHNCVSDACPHCIPTCQLYQHHFWRLFCIVAISPLSIVWSLLLSFFVTFMPVCLVQEYVCLMLLVVIL